MTSTDPADRPDPPPHWADPIGPMLFGLFMIASLWVAGLGAGYLRTAYRVETAYLPTTATVLEAGMETSAGGRGGTVYNPRVRLRYDAAGAPREEWARLDWSWGYGSQERAESDLRGFPVGAEVPAWYDPARPGRVVVARDCGWSLGLVMFGGGIFLPGLTIGLPALVLFWTAWQHRTRLEQAVGRVAGGEVREVPGGGPAYQPVLAVEYDRGAAGWRGLIHGETHPDRAAAEAELRALLSSHPVGEAKAVWYDPADRLEPTFAPLTFFGAIVGTGLVITCHAMNVVAGPFLVARNGLRALAAARPRPAAVPAWRRVLLVAASVLTIALMGRYVFRQDYQVFAEFEPTFATVKSAAAVPDDAGGFRPVVTFYYTIDGHYYERPTHPGWDAVRLRPLARAEAEEVVAPYPAGSKVLVWYDPADPLRAVIRRYVRWHLYPLLLPPLWVLVAQSRRLLRGE